MEDMINYMKNNGTFTKEMESASKYLNMLNFLSIAAFIVRKYFIYYIMIHLFILKFFSK